MDPRTAAIVRDVATIALGTFPPLGACWVVGMALGAAVSSGAASPPRHDFPPVHQN
jgi:hypothetical protein